MKGSNELPQGLRSLENQLIKLENNPSYQIQYQKSKGKNEWHQVFDNGTVVEQKLSMNDYQVDMVRNIQRNTYLKTMVEKWHEHNNDLKKMYPGQGGVSGNTRVSMGHIVQPPWVYKSSNISGDLLKQIIKIHQHFGDADFSETPVNEKMQPIGEYHRSYERPRTGGVKNIKHEVFRYKIYREVMNWLCDEWQKGNPHLIVNQVFAIPRAIASNLLPHGAGSKEYAGVQPAPPPMLEPWPPLTNPLPLPPSVPALPPPPSTMFAPSQPLHEEADDRSDLYYATPIPRTPHAGTPRAGAAQFETTVSEDVPPLSAGGQNDTQGTTAASRPLDIQLPQPTNELAGDPVQQTDSNKRKDIQLIGEIRAMFETKISDYKKWLSLLKTLNGQLGLIKTFLTETSDKSTQTPDDKSPQTPDDSSARMIHKSTKSVDDIVAFGTTAFETNRFLSKKMTTLLKRVDALQRQLTPEVLDAGKQALSTQRATATQRESADKKVQTEAQRVFVDKGMQTEERAVADKGIQTEAQVDPLSYQARGRSGSTDRLILRHAQGAARSQSGPRGSRSS